MEPFDEFYMICAAVGATLLACQFLMGLFGLGGHHEFGGDHDVGVDHEIGHADAHHDHGHEDAQSNTKPLHRRNLCQRGPRSWSSASSTPTRSRSSPRNPGVPVMLNTLLQTQAPGASGLETWHVVVIAAILAGIMLFTVMMLV